MQQSKIKEEKVMSSSSSASAGAGPGLSLAHQLLQSHPDAHRLEKQDKMSDAEDKMIKEKKKAPSRKKPSTRVVAQSMVMPQLPKIVNVKPRKFEEVPLNEPVQCMWPETPVVACADIEGRSAPEIERYEKTHFVCQYCALPAYGYCLGYPRAFQPSSASPLLTSKDQWILLGRFGSVGCMKRHAKERRHTWIKETGGLIALMLVQVYGCDIKTIEALQTAPAKEELPPYNDLLWTKWNANQLKFDSASFHNDQRYQPLQLKAPDRSKSDLQSEPLHCTLQYHSDNPASTHFDTPTEKWSSMQHLLMCVPNWQVWDPKLTLSHLQALAQQDTTKNPPSKK